MIPITPLHSIITAKDDISFEEEKKIANWVKTALKNEEEYTEFFLGHSHVIMGISQREKKEVVLLISHSNLALNSILFSTIKSAGYKTFLSLLYPQEFKGLPYGFSTEEILDCMPCIHNDRIVQKIEEIIKT